MTERNFAHVTIQLYHKSTEPHKLLVQYNMTRYVVAPVNAVVV